jgi:hypothetical protein
VLAHDRALEPEIVERRRGNLPALATPLVGRVEDLGARVADLDAHRLVTVVGPAGVGKTRLATEVARVRGHGQAAHVAVTAAERATIDAALDRARTHDPGTGLRIAVGFAEHGSSSTTMLHAARTAARGAPKEHVITALLLESWLEAMSGDLRRARDALDDATALAADDAALARWHWSFVLLQDGPPRRGPRRPAALPRRLRLPGSAWLEGASLLLTAFAHLALGDTTVGRAACENAIRTIEPLGDAWGLLHAEGALGNLARAEHRFADAA